MAPYSHYPLQPARAFFRSMSDARKQRLFDNTARAMAQAPDFIKQRHVAIRTKADPAYGAGVAASLEKMAAMKKDWFAPPQVEPEFLKGAPGPDDMDR